MNSTVAHTSVLLPFAYSGQTDLLQALYSQIVIPSTVRDNVMARRDAKTKALQFEIETGAWIRTWDVQPARQYDKCPPPTLGKEKADTILLAKQIGLDCLLDDELGRLFADELEVDCIGNFEILARCAQEGLTNDIDPLVEEMKAFSRREKKAFAINASLNILRPSDLH